MYLKNLNHRMSLRLDDELLAFVNSASEIYGISPSDFIRQCICSVKYGYDAARVQLNNKVRMEGSGNGIDRKEPINYKL